MTDGKGTADGATVRAFFALWPDEAARDALTALARRVAAETGGRAPAPENVHLTLAFLGDVPLARVAALQAIGAAVAATVPAFEFLLDRLGTFRGSGIAWAGASAAPIALASLAAQLSAALAAEGFIVDSRPFQAHVTLARRCRKRITASLAPPIAWPVARLVLNASELAVNGPFYRKLGAWGLGEPAAPAPRT